MSKCLLGADLQATKKLLIWVCVGRRFVTLIFYVFDSLIINDKTSLLIW